MEVKTHKRAFILGVFIVIGLLGFALAVFTLGGEKSTFTKKFVLNATFKDIAGLKEGNNIWLSGVMIGTVKKIVLKSSDSVLLTLNIEEKAHHCIFNNAKAKISSDGLLGNKIVIIDGGSQNSGIIQPNTMLYADNVSVTDDMLSTLQSSNKNIADITSDLKTIVKNISNGKGTIAQLINEPTVSDEIKATLTHLKKVSIEGEAVMQDVESFTKRINTKGSSINDLLTDSALFKKIQTSVDQLNAALDATKRFSDNIEASSVHLNQKIKEDNNPAGVILNDQKTSDNLKQTVQNLQEFSKELKDDLEALQNHWLLRGFFKKKNKL